MNHKFGSLRIAIAYLLVSMCGYQAWLEVQADNPPPASSSATTQTTAKSAILDGSVQQEETMRPSVKILISPPVKSKLAPPVKSPIKQFSGAQQYAPGTPAPPIPHPPHNFQASAQFQIRSPSTPRLPPAWSPQPVRQPPRWNYTITPRNGIMTWVPGYSITKLPQRRILKTHANLNTAFTNGRIVNQKTSLQLSEDHANALIRQTLALPALKATELALPQEQASPPVSWEDWYHRVGKAMYDDWKQSDVGAGKAMVLITVWKNHNVDCKVVDFSPALDVERKPQLETTFREASVRAVTCLDGANLWEFPLAAVRPDRISFDMEFNHAVGESPGCSVVHMHNEKRNPL